MKIPDLQNTRQSLLMREEGTYHHKEKPTKEMPGFLNPRKGVPLLLIPEYSGINKGQRVPERLKTAHRKPLLKCFLTKIQILGGYHWSLIDSVSLGK